MYIMSASLQRAHNPEVVGSNPAPATKNLQLVGLAGELFFKTLVRWPRSGQL